MKFRTANCLFVAFAAFVLLGCESFESLDEKYNRSKYSVTPEAVSSPVQTPADEYPPGIDASSILKNVIHRDYVFSAVGESGVYITSLEEHEAIGNGKIAQRVSINAWDIVVRRDSVYVVSCDRDCIRRIDVSGPTQPLLAESIFHTNQTEPIDFIYASEGNELYASISGTEILVLDNNLLFAKRIPFSEKVADMVEVTFKARQGKTERYLNIAVEERGIFGIQVPEDNPFEAKLIGFEKAPKPKWHLPDPGTITSLTTVRNVLFATAGRMGLREYLSWGTADTADNQLRASDFDYVDGIAIDSAYQEPFLAVLSQTAYHDVVTLFLIEHQQENGWNARRTIVDEINLPSNQVDDLTWYDGELWSTGPNLTKIVDQQTAAHFAKTVPEAEPIVAPPPATQTIRYLARVGGTPEIVAYNGPIIYATVDNELFIYDATFEPPRLINQVIFEQDLGPMTVDGNLAYLATFGFESGYIEVLDVSDPTQPQKVDQIGGVYHQLDTKDGYQFVTEGYFTIDFSIVELDADLIDGRIPTTKLHAQIRTLGLAQISLDTNDRFPLNPDHVGPYFSDHIINGNLLVLRWFSLPSCHYELDKKKDDSDLTDCFTGYVAFDLTELSAPKVIDSAVYDTLFWLREIDENGMLQLKFSGEEEVGINFIEHLSLLEDMVVQNQTVSLGILSDYSIVDFATVDDLLFIGDAEGKVVWFNLIGDLEFEYIGELSLEGEIKQVKTNNDLLAVQTTDQLHIFDLRERLQPKLIKTVPNGDELNLPVIGFSGEWLIYGFGTSLSMEKLTEGKLSALQIELPGQLRTMPAVNGNFLYTSVFIQEVGSVLLTIDFSDPSNIQIVDSISEIDQLSASHPFLLTPIVAEGLLLISCEFKGICRFNIATDPAKPEFLSVGGSFCTPFELVLDGVVAFCGLGFESSRWVWVEYFSVEGSKIISQTVTHHPKINVSNPSVGVIGDYLFVEAGGSGLLVFSLDR